MSSSTFRDGQMVRLDASTTTREAVTEEDVQDPAKLAELVQRVVRGLTELRQRFAPQTIDFEDVALTGSTGSPQNVRLEHRMGGRVRWYVVDWASSSTVAPVLRKSAQTDDDTLVLDALSTGTATIRVEAAA